MFTNINLVKHAKKALSEKWGYVYGTYGQILTEKLYLEKSKQYPNDINKYESFIRENWMGKNVTDCVGLIKSYIWWNNDKSLYDSKTDVSANGMYNKAIEKGLISTIPEIVGLCVRKDQHIGVYIGNGQVIESKGTKYGVVQTPLTGVGANSWTHWLKCPFIEYIIDEEKGGDIDMYIKFGEKSGKVGIIQTYLKELGYYTLEVDNDYGNGTKSAVIKLQSKYNFEQIGNVDCDTLCLLISEYKSKAATSEIEFKVISDKLVKVKEIVG